MPKVHNTTIRPRFSDIDVMGHVNNAIYLSYFEQARMDYFGDFLGDEWDWNKHGVLLARNEVDYLYPVQLHDTISIKTWVEKIGSKSLTMAYSFSIQKNGNPVECTRGKSILVCFDYQQQKTIQLPSKWREQMEVKKDQS